MGRRGELRGLAHLDDDALMARLWVPDVVLKHEYNVEYNAHQTKNQLR